MLDRWHIYSSTEIKEKCFRLEMKHDQHETNFDVDAGHAIKNQMFYTSF